MSSMAYQRKREIKEWVPCSTRATSPRTPARHPARRDKLVNCCCESDWYAEQPEGETALAQRVRELAAADDEFEMQNLIIAIYDLADIERAWLDPAAWRGGRPTTDLPSRPALRPALLRVHVRVRPQQRARSDRSAPGRADRGAQLHRHSPAS